MAKNTGLTAQTRTRRDDDAYSSWKQVSGYYDGDGSLKVHWGVYSFTLAISWADQYKGQLVHIREFLENRGLIGHIGKYREKARIYYELSVSERNNALGVLKKMLPHLDKKKSQAKAAIDYLENRITGEKFAEAMNEAVRLKKRSSSIRSVGMPYTKREGLQLAGHVRRFGKSRALTWEQVKLMKKKRDQLGLTCETLAKLYGVAVSTAHRSLTKYI